MILNAENSVDGGMSAEEALDRFGQFKPLVLAFSSTDRLMQAPGALLLISSSRGGSAGHYLLGTGDRL